MRYEELMNVLGKSYITIMANGDEYAVPVMLIAQNRARVYAHEFGDDLVRSMREDTLPLFEDFDEIEDWASNNMNWSDVRDQALKIKNGGNAEQFEESWTNGEHEVRAPNGS